MTRLGGLLVVLLAAGVALTASPATAAAPARRAAGFIQTPPAGQDPAQPATTPAPGGGQRGGRLGRGAARAVPPNLQAMGPGQIDQMFDAYMIYQAQPTLNLSDEQWLSFGLKLRNLLTIRHRLQRQRLDALVGLRELLKAQGPLDEAVVSEKLRAYDDLTLQSAPEVRQAYAAIDQVLRPRQRVQFRAFEEAMERKKLELIALARQRQQASQPNQGAVKTPNQAAIKK